MVRTALRSADVPVMTRAPRAGDDPGAAIVIDDAHLLADEELDQLAERVSDPGSTVVVAAEPLDPTAGTAGAHHRAGAREPRDIARLADPARGRRIGGRWRSALSHPTEVVRALMVSTAGLPFLLRPAMAAAVSPNGEPAANAIVQAARYRVDRAAAPSRRTGAGHPAGVVAEPGARARRRRGGAPARLPTRPSGWSTAPAPAD